MGSKTSYFNKTIFFKNVQRFWPVWTGILIVFLFIQPFNLLSQYLSYYKNYGVSMLWNFSDVLNISSNPLMISVMAVICGILVFSYLFTARSAYAIHSLPVTREELFCTNYISGLLFMVIPEFITYVVTALVMTGCGLKYTTALGKWFLVVLLLTVFFYSMITMLCQFSGIAVWAVVFFYIFNFLYVGLRYMIHLLCNELLLGFYSDTSFSGADSMLSPLYYMLNQSTLSVTDSEHIVLSVSGKIGWYLLVAVIFTIIGLILNHKRHLEVAGDTIAFRFMKPVFLFGVTLCGSLLLLLLIMELLLQPLNFHSGVGTGVLFLVIIILTFFCYYGVNMVLEKSFHVFRRGEAVKCCSLTVCILILVSLIRFDAFGVVHNFPDASEVTQVDANFLYTTYTDDAQKIQTLIDLHKETVDSMSNNSTQANLTYTFDITYHLKNGKTLTRSYDVSPTHNKKVFEELVSYFDSRDTLQDALGITSGSDMTSATGSCDLMTLDPNAASQGRDPVTYETFTFTPDQAKSIMDGYLMDIQEGNVSIAEIGDDEFNNTDNVYNNQIYLSYANPGLADTNGWYSTGGYISPTIQVYDGNVNLSFYVTTDCVHTLQVLSDSGVDLTKFITITEYNNAYND